MDDILTLGKQLGIDLTDIYLTIDNVTYLYDEEKYGIWSISKHNNQHDLLYSEQSNKKWSLYDITYKEKTKLINQTNSSGFVSIKEYKK
jgi:hypothetical protein